MVRQGVLCFYPERIAWIGATILLGFSLLSLPFVFHSQSPLVKVQAQADVTQRPSPLDFSLGLREMGPRFPIPDFASEMTFSLDPPRPDGMVVGQGLLVRIKNSGDSKRIALPCRLDLEFQGGKLHLAKGRSSFWIELDGAAGGRIEGKGYILFADEGKQEAGVFSAEMQECPVQEAQEFAEGSPFRLLAEGRWWGRDTFRSHYYGGEASAERIEIGADLIELEEGDWLVWNGKSWQKGTPEKEQLAARLQQAGGKALLIEGWGRDGYVRLSLGQATNPPLKTRGEELFSSIRIRSEKQISCMLEKQCMVLKTDDWVLKSNGRWRVLRKKEEREAYLKGKLVGEMLVFEQIHAKQGQKMIQARLFNGGRTQSVGFEMAAQSPRKAGAKELRKGRGS